MTQSRIYSLDWLRGIAVCGMVLHHGLFALEQVSYMFGAPIEFWVLQTKTFWVLQEIFVGLFLLISGICTVFSRSVLRRGIVDHLGDRRGPARCRYRWFADLVWHPAYVWSFDAFIWAFHLQKALGTHRHRSGAVRLLVGGHHLRRGSLGGKLQSGGGDYPCGILFRRLLPAVALFLFVLGGHLLGPCGAGRKTAQVVLYRAVAPHRMDRKKLSLDLYRPSADFVWSVFLDLLLYIMKIPSLWRRNFFIINH